MQTYKLYHFFKFKETAFINGELIKDSRLSCHCGRIIPGIFIIFDLSRTEYEGRFTGDGYSDDLHGFMMQLSFLRIPAFKASF